MPREYGSGNYGDGFYGIGYMYMSGVIQPAMAFQGDFRIPVSRMSSVVQALFGVSGDLSVYKPMSGSVDVPVGFQAALSLDASLAGSIGLNITVTSDDYLGNLWIPADPDESIWTPTDPDESIWTPVTPNTVTWN